MYLCLGDTAACDQEVSSIVSGAEEELGFLHLDSELQGHAKHGFDDLVHSRPAEPEIQKASQVVTEGISDLPVLINRLKSVSYKSVILVDSSNYYKY